MHLRVYLAEKNITKTEFAMRLGVSRAHFTKVLHGQCSHRLAERVEALTKQAVKAVDVCSDYPNRVFKPRGWQVSRKKYVRARN